MVTSDESVEDPESVDGLAPVDSLVVGSVTVDDELVVELRVVPVEEAVDVSLESVIELSSIVAERLLLSSGLKKQLALAIARHKLHEIARKYIISFSFGA